MGAAMRPEISPKNSRSPGQKPVNGKTSLRSQIVHERYSERYGHETDENRLESRRNPSISKIVHETQAPLSGRRTGQTLVPVRSVPFLIENGER